MNNFKGLPHEQEFYGQEWPFQPGERRVKIYVREPDAGVTAETGFMLLLHNWGGRYTQTVPWCDSLANRYNVIAISVDYLQSGESTVTPGIPYDFSYLQAMDCLRALYHVREQLMKAGVAFSDHRYYAAGGSGGGHVSLAVNKFAPHTFACVMDMCGMPGLTDEKAYGGAGYSRDADDLAYLTPDMQEIRDPGHPEHLAIQYRANPENKTIIVHGLDDASCSAAEKMRIYRNLVLAGFRPDGHFLTVWHVNNHASIDTTGHPIGNRLNVIQEFGDDYFSVNGRLTAATSDANDFERQAQVFYPTSHGRHIVDYSQGMPSVRFEA